MERTSKQWHRYFIEEISNIISNNIDKNNKVFIECGVKQGSSSARMAKNLNINGYLFDTWKGFPGFSDLDVVSEHSRNKMEERMRKSADTYRECVDNLTKSGVLRFCNLHRGDILKTVPEFVKDIKDSEDFRIAMMHIDTDLYEPAKISLECFWPYVCDNGVVYFHDYGDKKWRGIKKVVDELVEKEDNLYFHIFDNKKLFSACIVKGINNISEKLFNKIVDLDI